MDRFDVAVVGGGPGGATAAAFLSRAGLRTLLVDKERFPRDKSCGDAVCTKSVRILRELGLTGAVERDVCARVESQVMVGPEGEGLHLPLLGAGSTDVVYVIRRERFDNILFQHARSLPQVTTVEEFSFTDFLRACDGSIAGIVGTDAAGRERRYAASIVIGADGAMSRVAARAGAYDFSRKSHDHWIAAFRIYFRDVGGLADEMGIHFLDELLPGYLLIFPRGRGEADVRAGMIQSAEQGRRRGIKIKLRQRTYELRATRPRLRQRFARAEGSGG